MGRCSLEIQETFPATASLFFCYLLDVIMKTSHSKVWKVIIFADASGILQEEKSGFFESPVRASAAGRRPQTRTLKCSIRKFLAVLKIMVLRALEYKARV